MKELFLRKKYTIGGLLVLVAALGIGSWVAHRGQERFIEALDVNIATHREALGRLAQITDRNGADDVVGHVITDCARRDEFDVLLVKLGTLSKPDLLRVQNMFESCGSFYPTQKALMVARLSEEYAEYSELWDLKRTFITSKDVEADDRQLWSEIVKLEQSRSELITEQATLQKQIINALVQGLPTTSPDIRTLVSKAQEDADLISVYDKRIDELRATLKLS